VTGGPVLLPDWQELAEAIPGITGPMRRYLEQIACVLRPGSVRNADQALRSFAGFLACSAPEVTGLAQVTRRHIEKYKPWLAARPDAQRRVEAWCATTAGLRVHGTTAQRPAEHFEASEQHLLLALPEIAYDRPVFSAPRVAPDRHVEVARALYSVPGALVGQRLEARADSRLVRLYHRGQLLKTHPRKPPGGRSTDPADLPPGTAEYALRDVGSLKRKAAAAGPSTGIYAARILDVPLPWTSMRAVYRLLGLTRSYGAAAVDSACSRALELDVVDVRKIARMLEQATERQPPLSPAKVVGGPARFARDNSEYRTDLTAGRS
jgi:hypothetical protein